MTVNVTDSADTNYNDAFVRATNSAGNFVRFRGVTASGFTLTARPEAASDGRFRAPVNGLQIVIPPQ
jgi:hypothetical protein